MRYFHRVILSPASPLISSLGFSLKLPRTFCGIYSPFPVLHSLRLEFNKNTDYQPEPTILWINSNLELESLTLSVLSILLTAKFPEELSLAGFNQSREVREAILQPEWRKNYQFWDWKSFRRFDWCRYTRHTYLQSFLTSWMIYYHHQPACTRFSVLSNNFIQIELKHVLLH